MKKYIMVTGIIFVFFVISCVSNQPRFNEEEFRQRYNINSLPESTETEKYIEYENGFITVQIGRPIYYKFNNQPYKALNPISIFYNKYGDPYYRRERAIRRYFNINNKPYEWSIISLTPEVAIADGLISTDFSFIDEGNASFKVTVGDIEVIINATIINLPFGNDATYDNFIEILGFPNKESRGSAVWPSDTEVDGFPYNTTRRGQNIRILHLHYDIYPNVIFRFVRDHVLYEGLTLLQRDINNDLRPDL